MDLLEANVCHIYINSKLWDKKCPQIYGLIRIKGDITLKYGSKVR